jgi:hypothetical protein
VCSVCGVKSVGTLHFALRDTRLWSLRSELRRAFSSVLALESRQKNKVCLRIRRRTHSWYVACRDFTALFGCGSGVTIEESGLGKQGVGRKRYAPVGPLTFSSVLAPKSRQKNLRAYLGVGPHLVADFLPGLHSTLLLWLWSQDRSVRAF